MYESPIELIYQDIESKVEDCPNCGAKMEENK